MSDYQIFDCGDVRLQRVFPGQSFGQAHRFPQPVDELQLVVLQPANDHVEAV